MSAGLSVLLWVQHAAHMLSQLLTHRRSQAAAGSVADCWQGDVCVWGGGGMELGAMEEEGLLSR